ncbi:hypothetical protein POTOM_020877 [Populus tomentosa]|uniref:Uncharacterized protein n=1 Tax=Populus tomentosa TaxID=118781 RepID=A0A8X8D0G5_POPTO|nr:hypothetical protein POTOM_020877 [Populus tomentosa]
MSSIGVACAQVYVKQKRQMEKMKRMEEERVRREENVIDERTLGGSTSTSGKGKNKVHPDWLYYLVLLILCSVWTCSPADGDKGLDLLI